MMASGGTTIAIKDEASARKWLAEIAELNDEYDRLMAECGNTLKDIKNFADGTLVDEFYNLGDQILTSAKKTFEAIKSIADTVNNVIDTVKNVAGDIIGKVKDVFKIFG